jgi:hypothetical protein
MKAICCSLVVIFLGLTGVRAQNEVEKQSAPPAASPAAPSVPLVEEKTKSTFEMDANQRNPFWPIGWKPVAKGNNDAVAGPTIPPSAFLVSSVTLGASERFAIINGRVMKEGQQFGLQMGSQTYQITVKAIEDGQVVLMRRDEEIVVPLRRK